MSQDQPDNLVLKLLREIRATLDEHGEKLEELREDVQRSQTAIMAAVGYASMANAEVGGLLKEFKAIEQRISRLEDIRK